MKRLFRFLGGTLVTLFILLALIQVFLWVGLDAVVRKIVLPQAAADMGVGITVARTSADLLGGVRMTGIDVANPPGFAEPSMLKVGRHDTDLAVLSLLRGVVEVTDSRMQDVEINLIRNRDGRVNTSELSEPGKPATAGRAPRKEPSPEEPRQVPTREPTPRTAPPAEPPVPALLRNMIMDGKIVYTDHTPAGAPLRLVFPTEIRIENLATFEQPDRKWGTVTIHAHLADDPGAFVTDLSGQIAPVADPERPTFEMKGTVARIDLARVAALAGEAGVEAGAADASLRVLCRQGVFVPPSAVVVTLKKVSVRGALAKQTRGVQIPPELVITVPLEGTLAEPEADIEGAVIRSVLDALSRDPSALLRSLKVDDKTGREIEKGLKSLGDLFR